MAISTDLTGKRALVTGASSAGFGRFFAQKLARAGAEVVVSARRLPPLEELVTQLQAAGGSASAIVMDVTDAGSVRDAFAQMGPIDIVVNNAGVAVSKPILEQTEADFDFVLGTNLKGAWNVGVEAGRAMVARNLTGTIINIASITGMRQINALTPYAVSKAGVIQLTKQMALEFARYSVRVNAIAPGYFETDINRAFFASEPGLALIRRVPMRQLGDYDSLAAALFLLADDASRFITGAVIPVDGGHLVSAL